MPDKMEGSGNKIIMDSAAALAAAGAYFNAIPWANIAAFCAVVYYVFRGTAYLYKKFKEQ
jgi:hypothetical protein